MLLEDVKVSCEVKVSLRQLVKNTVFFEQAEIASPVRQKL